MPLYKETPTMSDNLRRYRAIHHALTQAYPTAPTGNFARHVQTLAALISGIVGSKSTQLPTIATKVPDGTRPESRVKRFARWVDNERILEEMYFLPYAEILLTHLALETLVLVMDGSVVGRGCAALMLHVIYKGRALPLAWRVRQGAKGYQDPLYLVSNMDAAEEACHYYQKRFRIETFFSDQKSRGFHLHKSHISDPQRLSRLLIAACLAYIWMIYLGSLCEKERWREIIHRKKRCDLSLFQLGLRILEHFLNEELPIPVQFHVTI